MTMKLHPPFEFEKKTDWRPNQKLVHSGFKDLKYLPRTGWNATLAAYAYATRRDMTRFPDLNLWAAMHNCPASARYEELGDDAIVLWHGTSSTRAEKIAEFGLFHKRGLWTTLNPQIAHGYTRGRSNAYGAGSATVVLLLDRRTIQEGEHYDHDSPEILRFRCGMPPEVIEYILWDDRIEFLGEQRAKQPRPWGTARFKKIDGRWYPRSQPPVRFDDEHAYFDKEEWLHISIQRILSTLESALAIEVFSSLYATMHPWEALTHEEIFKTLDVLCGGVQQRRRSKQFSLTD